MKNRERRGSVLLLVLWIVVIVSVLAISLGRETAVDLALTKHAIGKLNADSLAWSGLMYAMDQIQKSSENNDEPPVDNLYHCGCKIPEDKTLQDIFQKVALKNGYFEIGYLTNDANVRYGLQDEERKINLNAISVENLSVLSELMGLLDFNREKADAIAAAIIGWRGEGPAGRQGQGAFWKNRPFDHFEELGLVPGIDDEVFRKLKNFVTVFPKEGGMLQVNFNTAPLEVLLALARSKAGPMTNTSLEDARSLTGKMISYRSGPDGEEATRDDRSIDLDQLGLNAKEQVIFFALMQSVTKTSRYLRARVKGIDPGSGAVSVIEAVIKRDDLSIVSWREI